jgi:uncharacterized protein
LDRVLVDTGFLVALGRANDSLHAKADTYLKRFRGGLYTVSAVIAETCFHMDVRGKSALLDWAHRGSLAVVEVPVAAYPDLARTMEKYSDRNRQIDFADAALLWLAEESRIRDILTVDRRDFSAFRFRSGKRFELVEWF